LPFFTSGASFAIAEKSRVNDVALILGNAADDEPPLPPLPPLLVFFAVGLLPLLPHAAAPTMTSAKTPAAAALVLVVLTASLLVRAERASDELS
jgi:hypothetical protein